MYIHPLEEKQLVGTVAVVRIQAREGFHELVETEGLEESLESQDNWHTAARVSLMLSEGLAVEESVHCTELLGEQKEAARMMADL